MDREIIQCFLSNAVDCMLITCMARVYDRNENRDELSTRFDNMDFARRLEKGSTFVLKGFVSITEDGFMKITSQLEDIEGNVRREMNIPDIKNTCSTPKKAKIA